MKRGLARKPAIFIYSSFSFCNDFLRWLTFRKKKNLEREKLQVSLLENHNWVASFC